MSAFCHADTASLRGHLGLAVEDDGACRQRLAVERFVRIFVPANRRAGQAHARKQPARSRVAEDLRAHLDVGRRFGRAANRTGGDRSVRAHLELVRHQVLEPAAVHHDQDDVDRLPADLRADAAAGDGHERRQRPGVLGAVADADHALAALRREHEPALDRAREDGDRLGLLQDAGGNRLVRRPHDFAEHERGVVDALRLLRLGVPGGAAAAADTTAASTTTHTTRFLMMIPSTSGSNDNVLPCSVATLVRHASMERAFPHLTHGDRKRFTARLYVVHDHGAQPAANAMRIISRISHEHRCYLSLERRIGRVARDAGQQIVERQWTGPIVQQRVDDHALEHVVREVEEETERRIGRVGRPVRLELGQQVMTNGQKHVAEPARSASQPDEGSRRLTEERAGVSGQAVEERLDDGRAGVPSSLVP